MAKGDHLTSHQQGIVRRYYDNRETIKSNRLAEIVSDLALCSDPKKAERLWASAATALKGSGAPEPRASRILEKRDVAELARLAGELAGPARGAARPGDGRGSPSAPKATEPPSANDPEPAPEPAPVPPPAPARGSGTGAGGEPDPETLKAALKAFKKRVKLTRLDRESKLGHGPMSSGKKADFTAMIPPSQYPRSVWAALAKEGKIKDAGGGFYALVEP